MHSTALLCRVFLVVLPTLALPQESNSATSASSTSAVVSSTNSVSSSTSAISSSSNAVSSSTNSISSSTDAVVSSTSAISSSTNEVASFLASITASSAPTGVPSPNAAIAADFASIASELGAFETTLAKGFQALDALTSNIQTTENDALIATNEELAFKLAQAQTALAESKALALRNAWQAQFDIEIGKKACSLVQSQLDKWTDIGNKATTSPAVASASAGGLVFYIGFPVSLFTQEEATLGCPGKAGNVCKSIAAVIDQLNLSKQDIVGVADRADGIEDHDTIIVPQASSEQAVSARAAAVQSAATSIAKSIGKLKDALMC